MCSHKHHHLRILWVLVLLSQSFLSWSWFDFFQKTRSAEGASENPTISNDLVSEFSMEPLNSKKGMQLVEKAMRKAASSNSCWQNAYQNLYAGCSKILASEEKRSRFAWHLSDCFQKDTGRLPFPYCDVKSPMVNCLKELDVNAHTIYLEFYLETNTICHQLQTDAFKRQTERLVNDLKTSAVNAENKLENIQEQAEHLLRNSDQIHDSLVSIDSRTQQVAQTSKDVEGRVNDVLKHSEVVYEQSLKVAASQSELHKGQAIMKERLMEGMSMLNESSNKLGAEINNLSNEAREIEKEIVKVGDAMSSKMETLQSKANDIGNMADTSLGKQKQLLDGQNSALEVIHSVTRFQSQALEESRATLRQLVELGENQQQELIRRQKQLELAHDRVVENSKTILEAQETFESKQASMFVAINKLFALQNDILAESRLIKAFIVYTVLVYVLYMFTSTKQTYSVRPRLYVGLCATFLIEFVVLRYGNDIEQQAWLISQVRSVFGFLVAVQLLYAIYTYRDYESLNHQMLLTLIDKVNGMQKKEELSWNMDSEEDWSSWIDTDVSEDVDILDDPDYMIPEEVVGSSFAPLDTRIYNLRNRHCS